MVARSDQLQNILNRANSFHRSIKFTCELMKENQISFLDRTFKIDETGTINITSRKHRPTDQSSLIPINQKV